MIFPTLLTLADSRSREFLMKTQSPYTKFTNNKHERSSVGCLPPEFSQKCYEELCYHRGKEETLRCFGSILPLASLYFKCMISNDANARILNQCDLTSLKFKIIDIERHIALDRPSLVEFVEKITENGRNKGIKELSIEHAENLNSHDCITTFERIASLLPNLASFTIGDKGTRSSFFHLSTPHQGLTFLNICGIPINSELLNSLIQFVNLEHLLMGGARWEQDTNLSPLNNLLKLRYLDISGRSKKSRKTFEPTGLSELRIESLEVLDSSFNSYKNELVAEMLDHHPNLQTLIQLGCTPVEAREGLTVLTNTNIQQLQAALRISSNLNVSSRITYCLERIHLHISELNESLPVDEIESLVRDFTRVMSENRHNTSLAKLIQSRWKPFARSFGFNQTVCRIIIGYILESPSYFDEMEPKNNAYDTILRLIWEWTDDVLDFHGARIATFVMKMRRFYTPSGEQFANIFADVVPYLEDEDKKIIGDSQSFPGEMRNVFLSSTTAMTWMKEITRVSIKSSKYAIGTLYGWIKNMESEILGNATIEMIEKMELIRNCLMNATPEREFSDWTSPMFVTIYTNGINTASSNFHTRNERELKVDKLYLLMAGCCALICTRIPSNDVTTLLFFNDFLNEIFRKIPMDRISPGIVKFEGLESFLLEKSFISLHSGPVLFSLYTIQLLLRNGDYVRTYKRERMDTVLAGVQERWFDREDIINAIKSIKLRVEEVERA